MMKNGRTGRKEKELKIEELKILKLHIHNYIEMWDFFVQIIYSYTICRHSAYFFTIRWIDMQFYC